VFTTDAGKRWANSWTEWDNYDKFFAQMVRWSMRPVNEQGEFTVATDIKDGKVRVVVTAIDKQNEDEFLNFLNMSATAVGPDMKAFDVSVKQVAPGRYVGEFDSNAAGNYFLTINPGTRGADGERFGPIRTGISVPYSSEFRERETNLALLRDLAALTPRGGESGAVAQGDLNEPESLVEKFNTFRHNLAKAISSQDAWQWLLVIGACVFFADIFIRRVSISYDWIAPVVAFVNERVLRRGREAAPDERLDRLRSRKAQLQDELDERRATARFDPQVDAPPIAGTGSSSSAQRSLDDVLKDVSGGTGAPPPPPRQATPGMSPGQADRDDSYTARLLEAKKKAKRPPGEGTS
jgi:hypothetical protein